MKRMKKKSKIGSHASSFFFSIGEQKNQVTISQRCCGKKKKRSNEIYYSMLPC
jgi:hypothetical protein